jgi:hypothetical protein
MTGFCLPGVCTANTKRGLLFSIFLKFLYFHSFKVFYSSANIALTTVVLLLISNFVSQCLNRHLHSAWLISLAQTQWLCPYYYRFWVWDVAHEMAVHSFAPLTSGEGLDKRSVCMIVERVR